MNDLVFKIREICQEGTGASVVVQSAKFGERSGIRCHFSDFKPSQGPVFNLVPTGLTRVRVWVMFGKFSLPVVQQIGCAESDRVTLARALVKGLLNRRGCKVEFSSAQSVDNWLVTGTDFSLEAVIRDISNPSCADQIIEIVKFAVVPLMAAMAELIGYDLIEDSSFEVEGSELEVLSIRRERSPRNRLLCLSLHGYKCAVCGLNPVDSYGSAGDIIEVHHIEPLASLGDPRIYDPRVDLVPLCPNCHRAIHSRRPLPFSLDEIRRILGFT